MLAFDKVLHTIFFGQLLVSLVSDLKESLARFLKLVVKPSPEDRCLYLFQTYEINLFSSLQIFLRGGPLLVRTLFFRKTIEKLVTTHLRVHDHVQNLLEYLASAEIRNIRLLLVLGSIHTSGLQEI